MSTYVITGVSKGLGFEMLRQLSADSKNTVIGLVRDVPGTQKKISEELGERSNIHILVGDLTDYDTLKSAASETEAITGGSVDYLIANGAIISRFDAFGPVGDVSRKDVDEGMRALIETNVIGNIHLYNIFLPLVLKGQAKKVICITSAMADIDFCNETEIETGALYGASKAAMNVITAKFNAQYKKQGVLFMGLCPGMVDTGGIVPEKLSPKELEGMQGMVAACQEYSPNFKGPSTPDASIRALKAIWENASIEKGNGGAFLSHLGTKRWI